MVGASGPGWKAEVKGTKLLIEVDTTNDAGMTGGGNKALARANNVDMGGNIHFGLNVYSKVPKEKKA